MGSLKIVNPRGQTVLQEHEEGETISSLITRCNEAMGKMSNSNPHKVLIHDCALAMRQLCDQMWEMEAKIKALEAPVIN